MDGAPTTRFTDLVGCRLPIQQAPMGGVTTPALAASVAIAGGLGMLAATGATPEAVERDVAAARAIVEVAGADEGVIGIGFLMPFLDLAAVVRAAAVAPIVECFYGEPRADVVTAIHDGGAAALWQVGSVDEARRAVDVGCDAVVVQGHEAGGHVRGTEPLLPLLRATTAAVTVPVVAAGGIGTATDAAAAFAAGADGVRLGTVLLAAAEADVHDQYLAALVAAGSDDTVLTQAFSAGWPDAPHRVLRSCVGASSASPSARSPMPPTRRFPGPVAEAALYAGTSVGAVVGRRPAAEIVSGIAAGIVAGT